MGDNGSGELLNISTERPEPNYVTIDAKQYELVNPDDIKLRHWLYMNQAGRRIFGMAIRELVEADGEELEDTLDAAIAIILKAPAEVRSRLSDGQKLAILDAFSSVAESRTGEAPRLQALRKSSPLFSDSTEELPATGSTQP